MSSHWWNFWNFTTVLFGHFKPLFFLYADQGLSSIFTKIPFPQLSHINVWLTRSSFTLLSWAPTFYKWWSDAMIAGSRKNFISQMPAKRPLPKIEILSVSAFLISKIVYTAYSRKKLSSNIEILQIEYSPPSSRPYVGLVKCSFRLYWPSPTLRCSSFFLMKFC